MQNRHFSLLLTVNLISLGLIFALALIYRGYGEGSFENTYVLLADAFLHGRLHIDRCLDLDCIPYDDRIYVALPPFPAVAIVPFVAIFGKEFSGFIFIAAILFAGTAYFWLKILRKIDDDSNRISLILFALLFCTPLYYITLRSDGIWFFAQTVGFFLVSGALYSVTVNRNALHAGIFIGLAFLSRQLTVLYAPLLLLLLIGPKEKLLIINRQRLSYFIQIATPIAFCIICYFLYNYARFGSPLETGYQFIFLDSAIEHTSGFLVRRVREVGLFDSSYFLFNSVYLFLQGFHVDFGGAYKTEIVGIDSIGTSIIGASPFVLFLLLIPIKRDVLIGWITIAIIAFVALFYHSNGFSQHNVQRYTLDWLPIAFLFLSRGVQLANVPIFAILAGYAMILNIATLIVVATI